MYQSGRAGDKAEKRKSPAKSGKVGITAKYSIFIVDVRSRRFMYQSGRAGDEAKKHKSPTKSGRVGITAFFLYCKQKKYKTSACRLQ